MQINPLRNLLKSVKVEDHKPSLPPRRTAKPERNKVVGDPTRIAINKQAAMMLSKNRSWITQPLPPEKLPDPRQKEIDAIKAELKTERNDHAMTRDELGRTRNHLRSARDLIASLEHSVTKLKISCEEKDDIIRQLEDLKL